MVPVIERLQAGLPLTVVGLGSSIMSDHAGCFHSDPALLGPGYAAHRGSVAACNSPDGFVGGFMVELNRSYPNPEHVFINLGTAGTDLEYFARRHCFGAELPAEVRRMALSSNEVPLVILRSPPPVDPVRFLLQGLSPIPGPPLLSTQIDLIVIEQHDWIQAGSPADISGGRLLEELWMQLNTHGRTADAAPAVFLITTGFSVDVTGLGRNRTEAEQVHEKRCLWSCAYDKELVPTCGDFVADLFTYTQHAVGGSAMEDQHSRVLHWCAPVIAHVSSATNRLR